MQLISIRLNYKTSLYKYSYKQIFINHILSLRTLLVAKLYINSKEGDATVLCALYIREAYNIKVFQVVSFRIREILSQFNQ